jgi:hypothetical protein
MKRVSKFLLLLVICAPHRSPRAKPDRPQRAGRFQGNHAEKRSPRDHCRRSLRARHRAFHHLQRRLAWTNAKAAQVSPTCLNT